MSYEINKEDTKSKGIKFSFDIDGKKMGRAFLYLMYNDLHEEPFGFIEDVFIEEEFRGKGLGTRIVKMLIEEAKKLGCYKIICTSRYSRERVHKFYDNIGFDDWGKEFRINFEVK